VGQPRGDRRRARRRRPVTKQVVARALRVGEEVQIAGPFSIHHVRNSGIAFGFFASATSIVIVVTGDRRRLDARLLRRVGRPAPGAAGGARSAFSAAASANLLDRVRLGHVTDFLDFRLLAGVQPRRRLHRRRRRTLFGALGGGRPLQAPARRHRCPLSAFSPLRAERLDRARRRPGRGGLALRSPSADRGRRRPSSTVRPGRRATGSRAGRRSSSSFSRRGPLAAEEMDLDVGLGGRALLVVDKPAGVVVHRARGTRSGTLVHGCCSRRSRRRRGAAGDRPPPRPRHLRAARRRALGGGARASAGL
jgi:signal peptidase II